MLGLSSGLIKGTSVLRSIVKKGLQAWYKADNTQAPLGEEEIANGEFTTGPEVVINGNFASNSNWTSDDGSFVISGGKANATNSQYHPALEQAFTHLDKKYSVTYTISNYSSGSILAYVGGTGQGTIRTSNGTYTEIIQAGGSNYIGFRTLNSFNGSVDNVSVKQTNPNDSWLIANGSGNNSEVTIKDGSTFIDYDSTDNQNTGISIGGIVTLNKKYRVEIVVDSLSVDKKLKVHTGNDSNTLSVGVNTFEMMSTNGNTFSIARTENETSVTAVVSKASLKEITNSVKDFSPNTNNGVLYSGKCLHFDVSNYIDIDYWASKTIDANTKTTFATWVNPDDIAEPGDYIFGAWTVDNAALFYLGIKQNKLDLGWGDSGWTDSVTSGALPTLVNHTWYRVVAVVDGLTCKVYLNGEFVFSKTNSSSFTINSEGISIGAQGDDHGDHLYGELADFQIYDKAWTVSDVTYDYNNPDKDVFDNSNSNIVTTDCTALYRLNEGAGNRLYNAAPVLGEEIIPNPDLTSSLDDWNITNNSSTHTITHTANGARFIAPDTSPMMVFSPTSAPITAGKMYRLEVVISEFRGIGGLKIESSTVFDNYPNDTASGTINFDSAGTHTHVFIAGVSGSPFAFYRNASSVDLTIKSVSVKEISLSESYVQEDWVANRWITAQPYIPQYAMSSYSKKIVFGGSGSGDYVDLGSQVTVAADEAASISFWFTYGTTDTSTDKYILGKVSDAEDYLIINPQSGGVDKIQIRMANQTALQFDIPNDLTLGKMYHCVVTIPAYSSGSEALKCYINGIQLSSTNNRTNHAWDFQRIGGHTGTSDNFDGILDEIAYFSKELSEAEVQEIFNAGMALDCRDHSAFLGDEEFDDPGFDDPSKWGNLGTGWVVSGGKASVDTSGTLEITDTLDGVTAGKMYDISFEISDYSHGAFQFAHSRFHEVETSASIPNVQGNGTYSYRTIAQGSDPFFMYLYAYGASKFSIDNISVKEVNLKGYWRNNGTDTWYDLSPYGNNGTVNGSPTTIQLQEVPYFKKDTFGLPMNKVREKGLNLDGSSYITVDDSTDFNFGTTGFTVQFWVKPKSMSADMRLVTKGVTGNGEWMISIASDNSVRVYAKDSAGNGLDSGAPSSAFSTLTANNWAMVTVVVDTPNDKILFYKDNQSTPTEKTGVSWSGNFNNTRPLVVGDHYLGSTKFDGIIDDVKIYNKVLSKSEITKNYKATRSKHVSTSNWSDDFSDGFI